MPSHDHDPRWQAAECLLPGLTQATAEALGQQVRIVLATLQYPGVSFLGSLFLPADEVMLCLFRGPEDAVRAVSEQAGLLYERIIGCTWLGGQPAPSG